MEDLMEVDHIQPLSMGGQDEYRNLQLLHRHCHDKKTAEDMQNVKSHQWQWASKLGAGWGESLMSGSEWEGMEVTPFSTPNKPSDLM
jgi:hypothetical protein